MTDPNTPATKQPNFDCLPQALMHERNIIKQTTRSILGKTLIVVVGSCLVAGVFWRPLLLASFGVVLGFFPILVLVRGIETTREDWADNSRVAAWLNAGVYGCAFLFSLSAVYLYIADTFGRATPRLVSKVPGMTFALLAWFFIALGSMVVLSIGISCARSAIGKIQEKNYVFGSVLGAISILAFSSLFLLLRILSA